MPLFQESLFGSSIRGIQANLGWGNQVSTCTVDLVEDPKHSGVGGPGYDSFNPPPVGTPVYFTFQSGWIFNGILQNSKITKDINGNTLQQVTIVDPREILDGVQLILRGYSGLTFTPTVEIPNLFNVFGYLEAKLGFGGSQANETGMPWKLIKNAFTELANDMTFSVTPSGYGKNIYLGDYIYKINLDALPNLDPEYRIAGDSVSLMEFIEDVCKTASYDYFFTLQSGLDFPVPFNDYITLNTIERTTQPTFGKISQFLVNTPNIVSSETGFEFRNDTTRKFLVGGDRIDMYVQPYQSGVPGDPYGEGGWYGQYSDDTIWPYWGNWESGVIVGIGSGDLHTMAIDSAHLNIPTIGDWYITNVEEMRAAAVSREAWETFLWFKNDLDNVNINPQWQRAQNLPIIGNTAKNFYNLLSSGINLNPVQFQGLAQIQALVSSKSALEDQEEKIGRLYDLVRAYATEYFGRKFMVRIPEVETYFDISEGRIRHTMEPADAGYIDLIQFSGAVIANLLPVQFNRLTDGKGRFYSYMRFDDAQNLDLSEVGEEDVVFNNTKTSAFIKCSLDDTIRFVDMPNRISPRVIATLSGPVRHRIENRYDAHGLLKKIMDRAIASGFMTEDLKKQALGRFGKDSINFPYEGMCLLPNVAVVALKSNTETYGPWYTPNTLLFPNKKGKLEFQKDDSLVPWNYGGYDPMDIAARAKVNDVMSNMLVSEGGTVEFPGIPLSNLGSQLIAGGPYITDVQINIDTEKGVTSKYILNTWTPQFGTLFKHNADRIQKVGQINQEIRNKVRGLTNEDYRPETVGRFTPIKVRALPPPRVKSASSHYMIVGENIPTQAIASPGPENVFGSGVLPVSPEASGMVPPSGAFWYNLMHSNVCMQPAYLTGAQLYEPLYLGKAGFSLDGLFRPFIASSGISSIVGATVATGVIDYLPSYSAPASGSETPTAMDLNPFADEHDINIMIRGTDYQKDLVYDNVILPDIKYTPLQRGLGLRMPMIGVGWGYDSDGKPVPNKSGDNTSEEFLQDWKKRPQDWMVGPIDIRWNHDRAVWEAGGGSSLQRAVYLGSGSGYLHYTNKPINLDESWLNQPLYSGQKLVVWKDTKISKYIPVQAQFKPWPIVSGIECTFNGLRVTTKQIHVQVAVPSG